MIKEKIRNFVISVVKLIMSHTCQFYLVFYHSTTLHSEKKRYVTAYAVLHYTIVYCSFAVTLKAILIRNRSVLHRTCNDILRLF